MLLDIRFALRSLLRQRWVSLMIIACLALVIAGNTGVFAIFNSYILKPLPFAEPERLVMAWERNSKTLTPSNVSLPNYMQYRAGNRSFSELAAVSNGQVNLTGDGPPELLNAQLASPSFFSVLGTTAERGRTFIAADSEPGAEAVVILTHQFWQRRFGSRDLLGSSILLDHEPTKVVGILPADFEYLTWNVDVWLPFVLDPADRRYDVRPIDHMLGRLAPGVDWQRAREDLVDIAHELERRAPQEHRDLEAEVRLLEDEVPGETDEQLFGMIQGAGLFVLLIACANIANLLLARGQVRQRELAMRSALGAGKIRILRQLLTESIVLSCLGGALGILGGIGLVRYLRSALAGGLPQSILPEVDPNVILFSLGITLLAGVLFGLVPAFQALRGKLSAPLREGGHRGATAQRRFFAHAFVVSQVALALALLCGAGGLLYTFLDVQYGRQGFDSEDVLTFSLSLPESDYPDDTSRIQLHERLLAQLSTLPGVAAASSTTAVPRSRNVPIAEVSIVGREEGEDSPARRTSWLAVDPQYAETLGLALLRGRTFAEADHATAARVALVDDNFARRFFAEGEALGERVVIRGEERQIVGVVSSMRSRRIGVIDGPSDMVYLPFPQSATRAMAYLLKLQGASLETLAQPIRDAVWALDSNLPVGGLMTLDDSIALSLTGLDIFTLIVAAFAGFALILAALGLYGVLAYSVTQRRQEIGVRMAMGAGRGSVVGMVLKQGMRLTVLGLAIGLPLAWGVQRVLNSALAALATSPLLVIPTIVGTLLVVSVLASLVPARRASGLPPTLALRGD